MSFSHGLFLAGNNICLNNNIQAYINQLLEAIAAAHQPPQDQAMEEESFSTEDHFDEIEQWLATEEPTHTFDITAAWNLNSFRRQNSWPTTNCRPYSVLLTSCYSVGTLMVSCLKKCRLHYLTPCCYGHLLKKYRL